MFYAMVHEKATKTYDGPEITKDNYKVWVDHWIATAKDIKQSFEDEGLVESANHMAKIIEEQSYIAKIWE